MHHYSNTPGRRLLGTVPKPGFELVHASGWPAVSPDGRTLVVSERDDRFRYDELDGRSVRFGVHRSPRSRSTATSVAMA